MKAIGITVVVVLGMVLVFFGLNARRPKIEFADYSWSMQGQQAPYSFCVTNPTGKSATAVVLLIAETAFEGKEGVTFQELGRAKHEISLQPGERKRIDGAIQLSRLGTTTTAVSQFLSVK